MEKILLSFILFIICHLGSAQAVSFNVLDFGAVNDGKTMNTIAIQKAIDVCASKGGGTVVFPAGKYISGTIFLKSHITLNLEAGAILEGSRNLQDYPVTVSRIRSYTDNYTNKSLIYGEGLEYIGITGQGIIDGNGESFQVSDESRKASLFDSYKVRPYIIRINNSKNVVIKDITINDSPMWVQHYMYCQNVFIEGITVNSRVNHNNDGIDIDACDNVRISDCNIISGDDAIVIKSTLDKPSKNIVITNCILSSDCNAFKLGTESNGDFQNISVSNCIIYDTRLAGIALEMVDGGSLNNVTVSGINLNNVGCAVFIRLGNRARPFKTDMEKPGMGKLFNVIISNIQGQNIGNTGCSVTGLPGAQAEKITLKDIRLKFKGGGAKDLVTRQIGEFPEKYPEFAMFGPLPAYGFFCRHIDMLTMDNVELSYESPDFRPAIYLDDVNDSRISDLKALCGEVTGSLIVIDSSKDIVIRNCMSSGGTGTLASLINSSSSIWFINNILMADSKLYKSDISVKNTGVIIK